MKHFHVISTQRSSACIIEQTTVALLHNVPVSDQDRQTRALLWIKSEFTNALNIGILT